MMFGRMRSSSENRRPANRTIPEGAVVLEGDDEREFTPICPICGRSRDMYFIDIIYEAGMRYDVWKCFGDTYRGSCGGKVFVKIPDSDVLWVSPNGRWSIVREEGNFGPNFIVQCEGMFDNRYSLYSDGTYLKDNDNTPEYVEDAVFKLMDAERKRLGRWHS